jgi:hypothetical protein
VTRPCAAPGGTARTGRRRCAHRRTPRPARRSGGRREPHTPCR